MSPAKGLGGSPKGAPKSALKVAQEILERERSVVDVISESLNQIAALNPQIGAVVSLRGQKALEEAHEADLWLKTNPKEVPLFFGVPTLIKDLTEVQGDVVTHGSRAFADKIGSYDATVVSKIKQGGMILVGRSNSPEFGSLPVTENRLHGATRNPWNLEHTSGGSSGGAAAAVAAQMVPIAHASDGGGSIRIPASCCGLIGLKPQRGRVPKGPWVTEILHGISTDGCVSHTVEDSAAFLDMISHRDPLAWFGLETRPGCFREALKLPTPHLRIGYTLQGPIIPRSPYTRRPSGEGPVDTVCIEALEKKLNKLRDLGHDVFEAKIPWSMNGDDLLRDFIALWSSAGAYMPQMNESLIEPFNLALRRYGQDQSCFDFVASVARLQVYSRKFLTSMLSICDVLVTPTLAIEPPPIGWHFEPLDTMASDTAARSAQNAATVMDMMLRACALTPYTCLANITGQPAISVPSINSPKGLPIGVQLMGPPMGECLLLQLARDLLNE
jgi:amidase